MSPDLVVYMYSVLSMSAEAVSDCGQMYHSAILIHSIGTRFRALGVSLIKYRER